MADHALRRRLMVDTQVRPADVTRFPVIAAMLEVPREFYVPETLREVAYLGENLPLAPGRVVLEPRTLAKMLDALAIGPADLVLDIGCGLGYAAAVVARMAEAVVAVEEDAAMAAEAQRLLAEGGADNAAVVAGPLAAGAPRHAPYDAILIEGGIEVLPEALADQLGEGGRIAALFVEGAVGTVRIGLKRAGAVTWRFGFQATAPVLPGFARERAFTL